MGCACPLQSLDVGEDEDSGNNQPGSKQQKTHSWSAHTTCDASGPAAAASLAAAQQAPDTTVPALEAQQPVCQHPAQTAQAVPPAAAYDPARHELYYRLLSLLSPADLATLQQRVMTQGLIPNAATELQQDSMQPMLAAGQSLGKQEGDRTQQLVAGQLNPPLPAQQQHSMDSVTTSQL